MICPECGEEVTFDLIDFSLSTQMEGTKLLAMKYILRCDQKNGVEDLRKAIECIERLIAAREG